MLGKEEMEKIAWITSPVLCDSNTCRSFVALYLEVHVP